MSAFLVTSETINCVVNCFWSPDGRTAREMDDFGQKLWDMNQDAVNARYNETTKPPAFHWRYAQYSKQQQLKSLHCLIYQFSEGNVPERELFERLWEKAHDVAYDIASHTPGYEEALWDIAPR